MTKYMFDLKPASTVAIQGTEAVFPVNRIFCVGRNYVAHAEEMGVKPDKEEPFYFTKSPSTIVASGSTINYPLETSNYHYEMELVAAIGQPVFQATMDNALDGVMGYACGLDMTRRDLQLRAREKSRPWDLGKDFEESAVISTIVPVSECGHITEGKIELSVNDQVKQSSDISKLINSTQEVIVHLSRFYHLQPGDLIYTGTPEGVGPVTSGDRITGHIDQLIDIELNIS